MMAMSLDGFVARKDHAMDWLMKPQFEAAEGEDHGFAEFQDSIDAIVMGKGSFETVLGFGEWPYEKPVIVMSRTLSTGDVPETLHGKVEISRLAPEDLMESLGNRGCSRIYVDGGAIIRSFMQSGLVADMRVAIVPVLIGEGIRMFGELERDADLKLTGVKRFKSGIVELRYQVI
jgi:dihydrofolate reductase